MAELSVSAVWITVSPRRVLWGSRSIGGRPAVSGSCWERVDHLQWVLLLDGQMHSFSSLFKGAFMNIRQSRFLRLALSGVLALSALLGASSAMAKFNGTWTPVALENQAFHVNPGDFVRYGRTDVADCADNNCLGLWAYRGFTVEGSWTCSNGAWGGDPYPGQPKNCERLTSYPVYINGWGSASYPVKYVAREGSSTNIYSAVGQNAGCSSAGTLPCNFVYYIAFPSNGDAVFRSQPINSGTTCTNTSMGGDPMYGVEKNCFVVK